MSAIVSYLRIRPTQLIEFLNSQVDVNNWWATYEEQLPPRSGLAWDMDVNWHILHYALNGEVRGGAKPLWDAVLGGTCFIEGPIREDQPGHFLANLDALWESCRYLRLDEVETLAHALHNVDRELMRRRFNIPTLRELDIYRSDILDQDNEDGYFVNEILPMVGKFAEYLLAAAEAKDAIIIRMG